MTLTLVAAALSSLPLTQIPPRPSPRLRSHSKSANTFTDLRFFPRNRCISTLEELLVHPDYSEGGSSSSSSKSSSSFKPSIVVLATGDTSLSGQSIARALFERWRRSSRNLVLCTTEPMPGSLAHQLLTSE
jgi:hypothetical protein